MDAVFKALADESRRKLLDRLHKENGRTLNDLCRDMGMIHSEFKAGSAMEPKVQAGWPKVLSSLKSYLETGKGIDIMRLKSATQNS